jgi:hypothetical protein
LVAVIKQLPAVVTVKTIPFRAQPVAVPFVTVKVSSPSPLPPNLYTIKFEPKIPERVE